VGTKTLYRKNDGQYYENSAGHTGGLAEYLAKSFSHLSSILYSFDGSFAADKQL